jgi:hypothetical protein
MATKKMSARDKLRRFLSHPSNRGRIISIAELCRGMGISRQLFYRDLGQAILAKEWFFINQDSPLDVKIHYDAMLKAEFSDLENEKLVHINMSESKSRLAVRTFFIPREVVKKKYLD